MPYILKNSLNGSGICTQIEFETCQPEPLAVLISIFNFRDSLLKEWVCRNTDTPKSWGLKVKVLGVFTLVIWGG